MYLIVFILMLNWFHLKIGQLQKKQTILGANFELIILDEFSPEEKDAAVHEDICRTSPN